MLGLLAFVLFSGFTSPGGTPKYDNFFVVKNGFSKFSDIFAKGMESGYFYYEELVRELLPQFEGVPYGAGNVSCPANKTLVNFNSYDCVTFVETFYAMIYTIYEFQSANAESSPRDPFYTFGKNLNRIRYFGGENCGIENRIHYFTQELEELSRSGYAFNVAMANGRRFWKKINYISENEENYGDLSQSRQTKKLESILSRTPRFYYPKYRRADYYPLAQDGDIIAFSATEEGLDVSHCGIVTIKDGRPALNHASGKYEKVMLGQDLEFYLRARTRVNGFFVYRPVFN